MKRLSCAAAAMAVSFMPRTASKAPHKVQALHDLADAALQDMAVSFMPRTASKPAHKFQALHDLADAALQDSKKPSSSPSPWSLQVKSSNILSFKLVKPSNPLPLPLPLSIADLQKSKTGSHSGLEILAHVANDLRLFVDVPKKKRSLRFYQNLAIAAASKMQTLTPVVQNQSLCLDLDLPKKKPSLILKPNKAALGVGLKRGFEAQVNEEEECWGRKLKKSKTQTEDKSSPLLVITKQLFNTDLNVQQARFSIPLKQVISPEFLTTQEKARLDDHRAIDAILIQPCLAETPISLNKWNYGSSSSYVLNSGWTSVLKNKNNSEVLKLNATVQLWSFRCNGQLYLALTKPGCLDHYSGESGSTSNANGGATTSQGRDSHASTITFQDQH